MAVIVGCDANFFKFSFSNLRILCSSLKRDFLSLLSHGARLILVKIFFQLTKISGSFLSFFIRVGSVTLID